MSQSSSPLSPTAEPAKLKTLAAEKAGALDADDSVKTAGERMREHDASAWPVTQERKLVGMVDEKNPDWQIGGRGHDPQQWKVGQVMNHEVVFCYEDEDCSAARKVMEERHLDYLPVVDRAMRIVGIFSREEIAQKAEEQEKKSAAGHPPDA